MSQQILFLVSCAIISYFGYFVCKSSTRQSSRLPPGPSPRPIIGNLMDLPKRSELEWKFWSQHKDKYGPISSVSFAGKTVIIVNDYDIAVQLLEKRSKNYDSRPKSHFASMSGWGDFLANERCSKDFRAIRKHLYREIGTERSMSNFTDIQEAEILQIMVRLLNTPENLGHHIRSALTAITLKIAYGYTIDPDHQDPLVDLAEQCMDDFSQIYSATGWLVNFLPILRYLPSWMPGAGFIKTAKSYENRFRQFSRLPFAFVQHQMQQGGEFTQSFTSRILEKSREKPGSRGQNLLEASSVAFYAGGSDTCISTLRMFYIMMALFPHAQRKAQEELDRVVGTDRLPLFSDRESLPYINALLKEVMRWQPAVPMGIPHVGREDELFGEYLIPKESPILTNVWTFSRDSNYYHDPMEFKPERFLASPDHPTSELDPRRYVFGFGTRYCPGLLFGDKMLYLCVAQSLATFNISKFTHEGAVHDFALDVLPGVISHPKSVGLSIQPRSEGIAKMVENLGRQLPPKNPDVANLESLKL